MSQKIKLRQLLTALKNRFINYPVFGEPSKSSCCGLKNKSWRLLLDFAGAQNFSGIKALREAMYIEKRFD